MIKYEIYDSQEGSALRVGVPRGVKLTHEETGLVAACWYEASQHRNRKVAEVMLATGLAMIGYKEQ